MRTQETEQPGVVPRLAFGVLVLCALAVAGMYVRGGRTSIGVVLAGGLPVIFVVSLLAAALGWRHRRWLRLGIVVAILASQAPLLGHVVADDDPAPRGAPTIRVATLNTEWSGPTDRELVELADGPTSSRSRSGRRSGHRVSPPRSATSGASRPLTTTTTSAPTSPSGSAAHGRSATPLPFRDGSPGAASACTAADSR